MTARAVSVIALTLAVLSDGGRAAAEPTPDQVAAIKANCRSDYMSYCWSVPRGGPEAAQCLKKNLAKLSPACQQAVKSATAAAAPPSAPVPQTQPSPAAAAPAPSATPEASPPAEVAEPDAASAAATPQNAPASEAAPPIQSTVTPGTSSSSADAKAEEPKAGEESAAAPSAKQPGAETAASETAPVIVGNIPPRKKIMVFRNCRKDLETYCPDVSYGEGRQLHCLFSNKAALSPDCQNILAKLTTH